MPVPSDLALVKSHQVPISAINSILAFLAAGAQLSGYLYGASVDMGYAAAS